MDAFESRWNAEKPRDFRSGGEGKEGKRCEKKTDFVGRVDFSDSNDFNDSGDSGEKSDFSERSERSEVEDRAEFERLRRLAGDLASQAGRESERRRKVAQAFERSVEWAENADRRAAC
ncbi:MAG: hypothetical protein IKK39_07635, partial [Thermoguttaceae bacterium]|nr:hypothetical protein [Thermoguttaceae bacterium]